MDLQCSECREFAACVQCECISPQVAICQSCLPLHVTSPGIHAQCTSGTQDRCLPHDNPALHFCLCNAYICSVCMPVHHPPRDNHHVFSVCLVPVFNQDETGALLRQGELIEELSAAVQTQAKGLQEKLVQKVAETFDGLQRHLHEMRVHTLEQVIKYAKEFESESELLLEKLRRMKYRAEWQAETELEALIQREDRKELAEYQRDIVGWVFEMEEYKHKWETLGRLRSWKYLLAPPSYEPNCFAVANGQTHLFALPTLDQLSVPESLAWLDGSLLCLPSTEWFFNDYQQCHLISSDFTQKRLICDMKEKRQFAGLAHYRRCVYLFGGHTKNAVSHTVECVDIERKSTRLLACSLPLSFFGAMPCRQGPKLYFGPLTLCSRGYQFDLATEQFTKAPFSYQGHSNSQALAFPLDEVVVLSASGIYSFDCQGAECFQLKGENNTNFLSHTAPMRQQGVWYIETQSEESNMLLVMSESTKELQEARAMQKPDMLQRMLRGHGSLDSFLHE